MAEHARIQRSTSQSSIPVVTPRPSRTSISSTLPISQTSLVSQLRRTSESSTRPNLASNMALPQSPVSSIPSFRSIRNLLPFAPAKTSNPPPSPHHTPKPSFVNFGSLRRMTHDKKNSTTHSHPQAAEPTPVIAIARPSESFEEEMMARKRSRDINRSTADLSSSSSQTDDEHYVLPLPSSGPPLGADLSTIIEAENSGISKHLPLLGDNTHADADDDTPTSPFNLAKLDKGRLPSPDSRAASVFDLSTSRLAAEVMHALKVEDATTGGEWLKGVDGIVVEGGADDPDPVLSAVNATCGGDDPDAALDFDAVDPDLAELLSPNRINGKSPSPNLAASRLPSRAHSRSPSQPITSSSLYLPSRDDVFPPRTSPRLGTILSPSVSRAVVQSSPTRRAASLSRANPTRGPPSSLPRLMRSVTTAPPSASDSSDGSSATSGLRGPSKKRHQPPSPLSSQTQSNSPVPSPASSHGSTDVPARRLVGPRFAMSHRHVSSYAPGNSRATDSSPALLPSVMPSEKPSSSQLSSRSASDPARQPVPRPSLEIGDTLEVTKRRRPHLFYTRKRSMSVEESPLSPTSGSSSSVRPSSSLSNRPPVMEWLGPRTAKAFAAAGLLDGDRDGSNPHAPGPGKYASLRAHGERDDRFVPSRMAFSEAASTSSWGRSGSVSRGMTTPSEGGPTWGSPTFSAPRTAFSGSTAPTSISATSSQQAAMQVMKEKHDLETEALLSALSDSQRTTKTLREENLQLRDRICELEDELDETRVQIYRLTSGMLPPRGPPPKPFSRSPRDRAALLPSPLAAPLRPTVHRARSHAPAPTNGLSVPAADRSPLSSRSASPSRVDSPVSMAVAASRPRRRRASTTSSVFPSLPQNMSLLMQEETMHDRPMSSGPPSPPSPTRGISQPGPCNGRRHSGSSAHGHVTHPYHHVCRSSAANVSPTIASFCMTEMPGSPASLELRPEHELHLGDMASLSLYAMSDEDP